MFKKSFKKKFQKFIFFLWKGLVIFSVFTKEIAFRGTFMQIEKAQMNNRLRVFKIS